LRYADDIILIDAGMMFPEAELLGRRRGHSRHQLSQAESPELRAIFLTHGHEITLAPAPTSCAIFRRRFTARVSRSRWCGKRLEEHGLLDKTKLNEVTPGQHIEVGPFNVEFIYVTHSTIDCVALAVRTPLGVIIHRAISKWIRRDRRAPVRLPHIRALRTRGRAGAF